MEQDAVALEAIGESIVFLDHFKGLPDPRQRGKITYPLGEVLLLCLLAVLGGAETFVDIARFGEKKLDLLRRFRPRTITSAISLLPSTPRPFSAASSPGWQR
jgi:DDE_Tnp_1-associated